MAAGPPGIDIHVYALRNPWPRASLACGDGCGGTVRRQARAGWTRLDVEAPSAGLVVVRDNFARGWQARVDGQAAEVRRAGDHMAVAVGPGAHEVVLTYRPPGLRAALALTACGVLAAAVLAIRTRP